MLRPSAILLLAAALTLPPVASAALNGDSPGAAAIIAAPRDDTLAYLEGLPETNPYRATLLKLHALPAADRDALKEWVDKNVAITSGQQDLAREFSASLVSLSAKPLTRTEDWPVLHDQKDPDDPSKALVPAIGLARQLARLAVKTGDTLPAGEAVALYTAAAQFGRQQRAGATLIEQLCGIAVEGIAFSAAGRRLSEFSVEELQKLSAAWASLHPQPDNARAFAGEQALFFNPIINDFVRPGLAAILEENTTNGVNLSDAEEDPDAGFTRPLRLSGLVDLGGGERRISLENTDTAHTFTITEGKSTDGIKLVSLNFQTHEAIIRRGSREAVIHLESKRIVERRPRSEDAGRLRNFLRATAAYSDHADNEKLLEALLEKARLHPKGADGYADDLLATYQQLIDTQLAAADSPDAAASPSPELEDPLLKLMVPVLGKVARTFNNSATSATMLQAALNHRLSELGAASPESAPRDPWTTDQSPFTYEPTADGGFLLRSRYEVNKDQPLTYKFAAPDAGFVRPPK